MPQIMGKSTTFSSAYLFLLYKLLFPLSASSSDTAVTVDDDEMAVRNSLAFSALLSLSLHRLCRSAPVTTDHSKISTTLRMDTPSKKP